MQSSERMAYHPPKSRRRHLHRWTATMAMKIFQKMATLTLKIFQRKTAMMQKMFSREPTPRNMTKGMRTESQMHRSIQMKGSTARLRNSGAMATR